MFLGADAGASCSYGKRSTILVLRLLQMGPRGILTLLKQILNPGRPQKRVLMDERPQKRMEDWSWTRIGERPESDHHFGTSGSPVLFFVSKIWPFENAYLVEQNLQ